MRATTFAWPDDEPRRAHDAPPPLRGTLIYTSVVRDDESAVRIFVNTTRLVPYIPAILTPADLQ